MASIKTKADSELRKKEPLNTTIDGQILNSFKRYCKEVGIPMNVIIETFMNQFANGEFELKFGNNKMSMKLPDDELVTEE